MMKVTREAVEKGIARLITRRESFVYGLTLVKARVVMEHIGHPLAVTFQKGRPVLIYDPEAETSVETVDDVAEILRHEATHLLLLHPYRAPEYVRRHAKPGRTVRDQFYNTAVAAAIDVSQEHITNEMILPSPYIEEHGILLEEFRGQDMTAEEIANTLLSRFEVSDDEISYSGVPVEGAGGTSRSSEQPGGTAGQGDTQKTASEGAGTNVSPEQGPAKQGDAQKTASEVASERTSQGVTYIPSLKDLLVQVMASGKDFTIDVIPVNDSEVENEEIAREFAKSVMQDAKSRGLLPSNLDEYLKSISDKRLGLEFVVRRALQRLVRGIPRSTVPIRTRPSRRYPPGIGCGKLKKPDSGVIVVTDTSGSMEDETLQVVFGEIERIAKRYSVYWIGCDADAYDAKLYKRGMWRQLGLRRGGTDYEPAIAAAQEKGFRKIVYITDAICPAPKNLEPDTEVLWVVFGDADAEHLPGEVIRVTDFA